MNLRQAGLDRLFILGALAQRQGLLKENTRPVVILPLKKKIAIIPQRLEIILFELDRLLKMPSNLLRIRARRLHQRNRPLVIIPRIPHRRRGGTRREGRRRRGSLRGSAIIMIPLKNQGRPENNE